MSTKPRSDRHEIFVARPRRARMRRPPTPPPAEARKEQPPDESAAEDADARAHEAEDASG